MYNVQLTMEATLMKKESKVKIKVRIKKSDSSLRQSLKATLCVPLYHISLC